MRDPCCTVTGGWRIKMLASCFLFQCFSMSSRIMVGLPSAENREMILKTLLSKEKVEDLDFKELAAMTEGYSGSDLKVCY